MRRPIEIDFDTWVFGDFGGEEHHELVKVRHETIDSIKEAFNNARSNNFRIDGLHMGRQMLLGFVVHEEVHKTGIFGRTERAVWHSARWSVFIKYARKMKNG